MNSDSARTTDRIILEGDVDGDAIERLRDSINRSTAMFVVIDAAAVTFIDSSGVDALLDAKDQLEAEQRKLRVVNRTRTLNRLLDMCGMGEAFA